MRKSVWMALALPVACFLAGCGNDKTGTVQEEKHMEPAALHVLWIVWIRMI